MNRFSSIFFIVPFYDGNEKDIIAVYEHSFQFQGYIAQAYKELALQNATHYLFIGDDLFIHPAINENNYQSFFQIKDEQNFIPSLSAINDVKTYWSPMLNGLQLNLSQKGLEVKSELPSFEVAVEKFRKQHLFFKNKASLKGTFGGKQLLYFWSTFLKKIINKKRFLQYDYPLATSYSDILLISNETLKPFSHYCGVFSSARLFVEIAIPTALVLASQDIIVTEDKLTLKGITLWSDDDMKILDQFGFSIENLSNNFLNDCLYLHPIKLSKWQ